MSSLRREVTKLLLITHLIRIQSPPIRESATGTSVESRRCPQSWQEMSFLRHTFEQNRWSSCCLHEHVVTAAVWSMATQRVLIHVTLFRSSKTTLVQLKLVSCATTCMLVSFQLVGVVPRSHTTRLFWVKVLRLLLELGHQPTPDCVLAIIIIIIIPILSLSLFLPCTLRSIKGKSSSLSRNPTNTAARG